MAAGTKPLLTPSSQTDINYFMRHYTLKRLLDCVAIARSIFPPADMLTRIRPVYEDQFATFGPTVDALWWAQTLFGKIDIWGVSIAPYYGPGKDLSSANAVFASINQQIAERDSWANPGLAYWRSLTDTYGLHLSAYECGLDHDKNLADGAVLNAVAYDARSKDVTERYLRQLAQYCDGPLNYFRYSGVNAYREYGLTDDGMTADGKPAPRPKYDGAVKVATTPVPSADGKGLTWEITYAKQTVKQVRGSFCRYYNYWTGGPLWAPTPIIEQSLQCKDFTAVLSGKYTPVAGVTGLIAEVDANDSAVMAAPNTFTPGVPVDIKITYSGNTSTGGVASLRLWQVVNGARQMVAPWQLSPN